MTTLESVGSPTYIACLERGDKENHLQIQSAVELYRCLTKGDAICKDIRKYLKCASYFGTRFKFQAKPFEFGQNWLGTMHICYSTAF